MKTILITLGNHLSQSPRAQRVATLLSELCTYDVIIACPKLNQAFSNLDSEIARSLNIKLVSFCDLTLQSSSRTGDRLRFGLGRYAARYLNMSTSWALAYGANRALRIATLINPFFHYGFNEVGAYISYKLLGKCLVAADFEDYYSKDLLPGANAERPHRLLVEIESSLCRYAGLVTTASNELSIAFKKDYLCPAPSVVYNMFPSNCRSLNPYGSHLPQLSGNAINAVWFSKTIGAGRGLENLCIALASIRLSKPVHLCLIGSCSDLYQQELRLSFDQNKHLSSNSNKLIFVSFLQPDDLTSYLPHFDIGLALEQPTPVSRNLTVTYKFFQYISAGLAVIATPTLGQIEGSTLCPGAVSLTDGFQDSDIAESFCAIDRAGLNEMKRASREYSAGSCNMHAYDKYLLKDIMRILTASQS